jgi:hypothetical protein
MNYPTPHKHHIFPKHMGGDNSPDNITPPISVVLHAALHKDLYDHYGKIQDLKASRLLIGQSLSGIMQSVETRNKISKALIGKKVSEETKKKMSLSHKGNQNLLGHITTEETKNKISIANKGKKRSDETRNLMSAHHKGMKGKHHSEESKLKMSETMKRKSS